MYAFIYFIECTVAYMLYRERYISIGHPLMEKLEEKSGHHQSQLDSSSVRKFPGIHPIVVEIFHDYGLKFSTTVRQTDLISKAHHFLLLQGFTQKITLLIPMRGILE